MIRLAPALTVALCLAACAPADAPADPSQQPVWSLLAAYDASAVARFHGAAPGAGFSWTADPTLEAACGRPKGPIGFGGSMDAEILARGRSPALALLLVGPAATRLKDADLSIFVGSEKDPFALAPAVVPRAVSLSVKPKEEPAPVEVKKMIEQLRGQLTVQLCLEHQVGRGWQGLTEPIGLDGEVVQNTFMLDRVEHPDRRVFVGQGLAAASLLGPPRWAPTWRARSPRAVDVAGARLSAGDLFAFEPPPPVEPIAWTSWSPDWLQWSIGGAPCAGCTWTPDGGWGLTRLDLVVGTAGEDLTLEAVYRLGDGPIVQWKDGASEVIPLRIPEVVRSVDAAGNPVVSYEEKKVLHDVLSTVPYEYPRFVAVPERVRGDVEHPPQRAIAVLLIPNWQLVNARKAATEGDYLPAAASPSSRADGVGWMLENLELLHIVERGPSVDLVEYALTSAPLGPWGPSPDRRATAAPVVGIGVDSVGPKQQAVAVRRGTGNLLTVSVLLMLSFLVPGAMRVSELWSAQPRERAWGWPKKKQPSPGHLLDRATGKASGDEEEE